MMHISIILICVISRVLSSNTMSIVLTLGTDASFSSCFFLLLLLCCCYCSSSHYYYHQHHKIIVYIFIVVLSLVIVVVVFLIPPPSSSSGQEPGKVSHTSVSSLSLSQSVWHLPMHHGADVVRSPNMASGQTMVEICHVDSVDELTTLSSQHVASTTIWPSGLPPSPLMSLSGCMQSVPGSVLRT